jgi:hypothetical protein
MIKNKNKQTKTTFTRYTEPLSETFEKYVADRVEKERPT